MTKRTFKQPLIINNSGFTIIELLSATLIFSLILIVITYGIINISNSYSKGLTQTNVQNIARNIVNDISQAIQLNKSATIGTVAGSGLNAGSTNAFCIGSREYIYQLGYEVLTNPSAGTDQAYNGLVVVPYDSNCQSDQNNPPNLVLQQYNGNGTEYLGPHMRLSYLCIEPANAANNACKNGDTTITNNDLYDIDVQITYGDDVLLSKPAKAINGTTTCLGTAGSQFCTTSPLYTVVEART